ncbi:DUF4153 domain-containing protein [Bifidobacterium oedipodis]|uniref:DUF4173 domain-containing protein n=1 Tax=Bifidobacterium oedipodis TaxID=2675322 RepID=A0A7Y0HRU6_9BIFI|nr:DUF4173 domain-containing protein [Bifidobacterium sp. DSM 109957]NMM94455.1 hypothetical protein [Bifidobacterium sp. DSM 109957]
MTTTNKSMATSEDTKAPDVNTNVGVNTNADVDADTTDTTGAATNADDANDTSTINNATATQPSPAPVPEAPFPHRLAILAAAIAVPVLFDRLMLTIDSRTCVWTTWGLFCLTVTAIDIALFAVKAKRSPLWWLTNTAAVACCVWLMMFNHTFASISPSGIPANAIYAALTSVLVLPSLLMAALQLSPGLFDRRRPAQLVVDWLGGWFVSPFTRWGALARTLSDLSSANRSGTSSGAQGSTLRKIGIALLIALPIVALLVPLLMQADEVFSYAVVHVIDTINVSAFVFHTSIIIVLVPLAHSLLASVDERRAEPELHALARAQQRRACDATITTVVLAMVLALYVIFCAFQFTFLFAGAGLPAGYTYSEYARQGFFQLLLVAALNLGGFALVLLFAPRTKPIMGMQIGLLAATGVMLASAATRLALYIAAYGMTWLRWLSLSFIAVLAIVLALAFVRLFNERIPMATMTFVLLLVWWLALGYSNPDWVIAQWNMTFAAHATF